MQIRFVRSFVFVMASRLQFRPLAVLRRWQARNRLLPRRWCSATGWQLQDAAKAPQPGAEVAQTGFDTAGWYTATVPGTVLTTLVNNHVYPEPLYGENNRPEVIPDSLARTSYWYRTTIDDSADVQGPARVAELRRHQLLGDGVGEWRAGGHDARGIHPRNVRHYGAGEAGREGGDCGAGDAAAASGRAARTHAARGAGTERRRSARSTGRRFFRRLAGTGFRRSATATRGIWQKVFLSATGPVLREGSAGDHRPSAAEDRLGRRGACRPRWRM